MAHVVAGDAWVVEAEVEVEAELELEEVKVLWWCPDLVHYSPWCSLDWSL